jgi:hypothetical protein
MAAKRRKKRKIRIPNLTEEDLESSDFFAPFALFFAAIPP